MNVKVSIGEAVDKLSILEIKHKRIPDVAKLAEVQKEIDALSECEPYKKTYAFFYHLLMYINEHIWDLTVSVKQISFAHTDFAKISNEIFEYNQKRFRIKNWFNLITSSDIKEQKSYATTHCRIHIPSQFDIYTKIPEINYLILDYDVVSFDCDAKTLAIVQRLFTQPTILYANDVVQPLYITIDIARYALGGSIREKYEFLPITYVAGGLLGDFIQALSVVCEKHYDTGRKGIVCLSSEKGDPFRFGLENTYKDTYKLLSAQSYIKSYKIHSGEPYDVDLTIWRTTPGFFNSPPNWYHTYSNTYNVQWGKHPWIRIERDNKWNNRILVNTTNYRWPNLDFQLLYKIFGDSLLFISADAEQYTHFCNTTNLSIEYQQITDFDELCCAIGSCGLFVGALSAPLAIAHAVNVPRIIGLNGGWDDQLNVDFRTIWKNVGYHVEELISP